MQVNGLCGADWISHSMSIWQDYCDAMTRRRGSVPAIGPEKGEREYITEEQVRHVRYQRLLSAHLLKKYEYQHRQHRQYESEDEEYECRTGKSYNRHEDSRDHWHCHFFMYC
jgi:hypothetical protein